MERRKFVASAAVAVSIGIAGCSGGSDGDGSDGGDDETTESRSLEDFVTVASTDFGYDGTVQLAVTLENVSDSELALINVQSNLYIDNERVADSSMNVSNLPAGTEDTAEVPFRDLDPRDREDVTNYDVTVQTSVGGESYEDTFEYDGGVDLE